MSVVGSSSQSLSPIISEDYLTAGSLLRGAKALSLPASAGLPSAGGGVFKPVEPTSDVARSRNESEKNVGGHGGVKGRRKTRKVTAIFVKTSKDTKPSVWNSGILREARNAPGVGGSGNFGVGDEVEKSDYMIRAKREGKDTRRGYVGVGAGGVSERARGVSVEGPWADSASAADAEFLKGVKQSSQTQVQKKRPKRQLYHHNRGIHESHLELDESESLIAAMSRSTLLEEFNGRKAVSDDGVGPYSQRERELGNVHHSHGSNSPSGPSSSELLCSLTLGNNSTTSVSSGNSFPTTTIPTTTSSGSSPASSQLVSSTQSHQIGSSLNHNHNSHHHYQHVPHHHHHHHASQSQSLSHSPTHPPLGCGLPPAGPDLTTKGWDNAKALIAGKLGGRRSTSWNDMNASREAVLGGGGAGSVGAGLSSRRVDTNSIPGLAVGAIPPSPTERGLFQNWKGGSIESLKSREFLKRRLKELATRSSREQVAYQIQESLEAEKKAREAERKSFLQQRAEIVCLNHIMRIIEEAKWEEQKKAAARASAIAAATASMRTEDGGTSSSSSLPGTLLPDSDAGAGGGGGGGGISGEIGSPAFMKQLHFLMNRDLNAKGKDGTSRSDTTYVDFIQNLIKTMK
ncbi:hypothetical protein HDU76_001087, partial [Blyttiomyces sp. JEL0837]